MYHSKEAEEVLKELNTNIFGLEHEEAIHRLNENGKNILPSKKRDSLFKIAMKELASPIDIILILTVVISFVVGENIDAWVILFIITVDVIIGTYEENKALKSAESLSKLLKVKTKVLRGHEKSEIDSEELTIGDIILLESGTKITADARILESFNLRVDESVLTGESALISKNTHKLAQNTILAERKNMLYAGTSVLSGRGKAVVVAISSNTEVGKIAHQVNSANEEKSPLTIRMKKFSKQISLFMIIIAFLSFLVLYQKGYDMKTIFLSVVALAVSALPEGLPLALTMALTIASNRMSKKHVIVKKLNSVESLGSCTVIATDKTGTLTVNEQTARKIVLENGKEFDITGIGYNIDGEVLCEHKIDQEKIEHLVQVCAVNNEAHFEYDEGDYIYYGDSIDIAFLVLKEKMKLEKEFSKEKMIPYESEKGYSAVFYKKNNQLYCTVKGSIEKVMEFSSMQDSYIHQNEELSKQGYRVIAVADGIVNSLDEKDIQNLNFLGMVGFIDPIREGVVNSITECRQAGIDIVMVTGDHPLTSLAIAKELRLADTLNEVVTGAQIEEAYQKGEDYFDHFIKNKKVFSRVTPFDKYHIVESFKRRGEFIAVTGDGVNDAPAIKSANIGIAMGSGTDVAKDAASMIILDDHFTSIVEGIKEGRIAYANIRKIILFLLSCGISEILFYLFSVGFGYDLPLLAVQLLWINIVTDGIQDIALSFEKSDRDVMKEKPKDPKESLFNKDLMMEVVLFGTMISLMIFSVWKYLIDHNIDIILSRTIIMFLMVFIQNLHVLNCRSEKNSIFKTSLINNPLMIICIIGSIALQFMISEVPLFAKNLGICSLSISLVLLLFSFSSLILIFSEIYKYIVRKK